MKEKEDEQKEEKLEEEKRKKSCPIKNSVCSLLPDARLPSSPQEAQCVV